MALNDLIWAERFRPQTLADAILPESTKKTIRDAIDNGSMQNFLFTGTAGTGKTTLARVIANELNADLLFINASLEGIETVRMKVVQFSSSVSFSGGHKIVLLDEADGLSAAAQQGLRGVIEEFKNTRYIFTCNFKNKVIDAIHSRCLTIDFGASKEEAPKLQGKFFKRVLNILDGENVTYEKPVVAELVKKFYPDFRKTLNELQRYAAGGKIDAGILLNSSEAQFKELIEHLKTKNFSGMRKWVSANQDIEAHEIFRMFYDSMATLLVPETMPQVVMILADRSYHASQVADPQIIIAAALTEIMFHGRFLP